jgi:hypothetical protein
MEGLAEKTYTSAEMMAALAEGYIMVHPQLWDYIPAGAHVRYVAKNSDGETRPREERFKPGGFVRHHYVTREGQKMFSLENAISGCGRDRGHKMRAYKPHEAYLSFPMAYNDIEELWKKYDKTSFIEIHLIYNSLAQKKQQIEDLTRRVAHLEKLLDNSAAQLAESQHRGARRAGPSIAKSVSYHDGASKKC